MAGSGLFQTDALPERQVLSEDAGMAGDDPKAPRSLPDPAAPGGPVALALGCICSSDSNKDGFGVETPTGGRLFYPNNNCPLHGLEAVRRHATNSHASRNVRFGQTQK